MPEYTRVRVPVKEMLHEFPAHEADEVRSGGAKPQPNLKAIWDDALEKDHRLTQTEAEKIALKIAQEAGVKLSRPKIRELWKTLYGRRGPGPTGPRRNRANPTA